MPLRFVRLRTPLALAGIACLALGCERRPSRPAASADSTMHGVHVQIAAPAGADSLVPASALAAARASSTTPEAAIRAFFDRLAAGDLATAYALLAPSFQPPTPRELAAHHLRSARIVEMAPVADGANRTRYRVTVDVTTDGPSVWSNGRNVRMLTLVSTAEGWRIEGIDAGG